jgi:hypothetical protein
MFIHYLKFKMPLEFIELIKSFQNKINDMDITNTPSWSENYSKSVILFEGQSKGHPDKIQTLQDVNILLYGFIERYSNILPEVYVSNLIINTSKKGKKYISLVIESPLIHQMRMDLIDIFGYNFYSYDDIVVKKFRNSDGSENIITESINIELPIISESYIKKNISIYNVCSALNDILILSNLYNDHVQPHNIMFETENKRGKKINLW